MPRLCTVCTHPAREQIDMELALRHRAISEIASAYGVGRMALERHLHAHLQWSWHMSKMLTARLSADNLLTKLGELDEITRELLTESRTANATGYALAAIRESRANIDAFSRIGPAAELEQRIRALEAHGHIAAEQDAAQDAPHDDGEGDADDASREADRAE